METIMNFLQQTGFSMIPENWKMLVMIAISLVLAYLAIVKKFEPLLLPISFGMLLTNLPGAEMFHESSLPAAMSTGICWRARPLKSTAWPLRSLRA